MTGVGGPDYSLRTRKTLCPAHVADAVLRARILADATEPTCSYCVGAGSSERVAVRLDVFMNAFMAGVYLHYQPHRSGTDLEHAADSEDVACEILRIAGISDSAVVEDIVSALRVTPHWLPRDRTHGSHVEQLTHSWETFKHLVKHEMRFFFAKKTTGAGEPGDMTAEQLLQAVSDVGQNTPEVWPVRCPSPIFRARMAASQTQAAQWLRASDLGSPPPARAAANRMSPAGISIFYGATDRTTAIAEAGSHSPHRFVVTGEFTPTRETRLIDLTNLPDLPSCFDAARHREYFGLHFLQRFVHDVTLPVELDGREHIDYVPTQVFTEYLRYAFPTEVDGLMFPSTQGPGHNIVMFFGPDRCSDKGAETERTRLSLDLRTVTTSRVMTIAR